jgi:hypothetical protein
MVMDMSAKKQAREERMQAKKEMIKEQKGDVDTEATESIPADGNEVPLAEVPTEKSKVVEAPDVSPEKTATPRKGQAS